MKSDTVWNRLKKWGLLFLFIFFLMSFYFLKKKGILTALNKSTAYFKQHTENPNVFYEPGAEAMADRLALFYNQCRQEVEIVHGLPFKQSFNVFMCVSQRSLNEFIAMPPDAPIRGTVVFGDVFISPSAFRWHGEDTSEGALIHEMSHLHIRQYCGFLRTRMDIPSWFHEGLADLTCRCAGETISKRELLDAFSNGRHFNPVLKGGLFKTDSPIDYKISYPMFHAQTRLFVQHLFDKDNHGFKQCVSEILKGEQISYVFQKYYRKTIPDLFYEFKEHLLEENI